LAEQDSALELILRRDTVLQRQNQPEKALRAERNHRTKSDIVVLDGSTAGIPAAITARRHHPSKAILLVPREKQAAIPCGIPYIFGTLGTPEKNLIPDAVLEKHGIDLLIAEATGIDREQHKLVTSDSGVEYERLILPTGSLPSQPPIPGVDLDGVFPILKNVEHLHILQNGLAHASATSHRHASDARNSTGRTSHEVSNLRKFARCLPYGRGSRSL
jgi:NADH dehydrogenase FAD-containing subunit